MFLAVHAAFDLIKKSLPRIIIHSVMHSFLYVFHNKVGVIHTYQQLYPHLPNNFSEYLNLLDLYPQNRQ